jgi:hypothetical protein
MLHEKITNNQIQYTMKNHIRILQVLFLLIMISQTVIGQTGNDKEVLLQKLADRKDLQNVLPKNNDGTFRQLYILQQRIIFPENTNVQIAGKKLELADQAQIESIANPYYLLFWDFRISEDKANIGFMINNRPGVNTVELVRVVAVAEKQGDEWVIVDTKINNLR